MSESVEKFLTIKEVVVHLRRLNITRSEKAVRKWITKGALPATCPGGQYLIALSDVERLLRPQRRNRG